ncbi:hypothetical protein GGQ03_000586 [Salinibacter ruber]|jgi:hypothetical protein|uniref:hypothetical protein n=1 Tax=Salinibacter ruber TaxID=146919 RepID=UPI0021681562|nr:hypothetical protein [Salinibacter ruber]MCS4153329.1 hypothetical protein [Salinibacter ruber]
MIDPIRESFYEEIFLSPKDQRVPVEIVSTDPVSIELEQMAQLVVPIAGEFGFVPLSSDEKLQPLAGWKELKNQLEFWMARSTAEDLTYLQVTGEAGDHGMRFSPESGLQATDVEPASFAYSQGPGSSLASTPSP